MTVVWLSWSNELVERSMFAVKVCAGLTPGVGSASRLGELVDMPAVILSEYSNFSRQGKQ